MLIGLLSDAHGNPLALSLCLDALRSMDVERIYFLGDAVGYLPGETRVLSLLTEGGVDCILGNHDAMLLGILAPSPKNEPAYRHLPARERLGQSGLEAMRGWPRSRQLQMDGRRLLLVHGEPHNDLEGYCYPDSDLSCFAELPFDAVFCGHTHRPFIRSAGEVLVVNVGSCGLPRDQGDSPCFATFDTQSGRAEIYRLRLPVSRILAQFDSIEAEAIHPMVVDCFSRQSATEPVGRYLGGPLS